MRNLNYYLTSAEPEDIQTKTSQSIGGYCSNSLLYDSEFFVSETIGLYETSISISHNNPSQISSLEEGAYFYINNEMMKIESIDYDNLILQVDRAINNILQMHIEGDFLKLADNKLFNDVFNSSNEQYRCIAIKNDSSMYGASLEEALELSKIYIEQNSRNSDVNIELSIDIPVGKYKDSYGYFEGSDFIDVALLSDSSIVDNAFVGSVLKIEDEYSIVSSYDSSSGTFVFEEPFSDDLMQASEEFSYEVFPSPAQRLKSGINTPESLSNMSEFGEYSSEVLAYSFDSDSILYPNDIIYLWIKRTVEKGASSMLADDFMINIFYRKV